MSIVDCILVELHGDNSKLTTACKKAFGNKRFIPISDVNRFDQAEVCIHC